mmetsp:Transcript_30299/g.61455  ORF Transcript_30299/g.61455 Transcript_30299/m.61455 type:complete len:220 (+) Transcript_30299:2-661(+)
MQPHGSVSHKHSLTRLQTRIPLKRTVVEWKMLADGSSGEDSASGVSGSELAKEIEKSFVVACTQISSSYEVGLTAFAEAVISAYEEGYSVPSMSLELSSCPQQTLGRPLQADEVELRQVWMSLVYLTLQTVAHPRVKKDALSIPTPLEDRFLGFVRNIVQAHAMGSTLQRLKLEEMMNREEGSAERSPVETAILSQAMRIVFITLDVLKREAEEDAAAE